MQYTKLDDDNNQNLGGAPTVQNDMNRKYQPINNGYPTYPVSTICPKCNKNVLTNVVNEPGCGTYLISGVVCCICCPLFFVPCFIKEAKDATHYCPNCNNVIGVRKLI